MTKPTCANCRENRAKFGLAEAGFAVQNLSVEWGICEADYPRNRHSIDFLTMSGGVYDGRSTAEVADFQNSGAGDPTSSRSIREDGAKQHG